MSSAIVALQLPVSNPLPDRLPVQQARQPSSTHNCCDIDLLRNQQSAGDAFEIARQGPKAKHKDWVRQAEQGWPRARFNGRILFVLASTNQKKGVPLATPPATTEAQTRAAMQTGGELVRIRRKPITLKLLGHVKALSPPDMKKRGRRVRACAHKKASR